MDIQATFQPLVGVLRVHPFGGMGTPWTWACTCAITGDSAFLYGVAEAPTPSQWRALRKCFINMGVTKVSYDRRNTNYDRLVTIDLSGKET